MFDEAGNFINDFALYTDSYANEISADHACAGVDLGRVRRRAGRRGL